MINGDTLITVQGDKLVVREYKAAYNVPINDFVKKYAKLTAVSVESPELPRGTIKYAHSKGVDEFFIHVPMGEYRLLDRGVKVKVIMPHTLIRFKIKGKVMQGQKITWNFDTKFSLKSKKFTYLPMQNIYDDKKVCIGRFPAGSSGKEVVDNFMTAFFENNFNNDINKGDACFLQEIAKDQEQMKKDGLSTEKILQRWFKTYDPKKKELTKNKCYSSGHVDIEKYKTLSEYMGS